VLDLEEVFVVESEDGGHYEKHVRGLHDVSTFPFLRTLMCCSCVEYVTALLRAHAEDTNQKIGAHEIGKTMNESESDATEMSLHV